MSVRIQFDISDDEAKRLYRYESERFRHKAGYDALMEKINRNEAKDKKLQEEKLLKDAVRIQKLIDKGLINFKA